MRRLFVLIAWCGVLVTGTAFADVLRVPDDFTTIAGAEAAAADGDTILIVGGRYQEAVVTTKSLTFKGTKGAVWDGYFAATAHDQLTATADGVTVKGIRFEHGDIRPVSITGDRALVTKCRFRSCAGGVFVDGAQARIIGNRFSGQTADNSTIEINGPNGIVQANQLLVGDGALIRVDAENGGTATVTKNVIDTQKDDSRIEVLNATAPQIVKNKVLNAYMNDPVISVEGSDDAFVSKNTLSNINYNVQGGIWVTGARAMVIKNCIQYLNYYDSDMYPVYVVGDDAVVQKNKVHGCGAGEDGSIYGVHVDGHRADVSRNRIYDLAGGGETTYGIYIDGNDGLVEKNKIFDLTDEYTAAIYYDGDRARVVRNRVTFVMDDEDIYVIGDDFLIQGNTVQNGARGCRGIYARGSATSPGAAVIELNTIGHVADEGIALRGNGVIVRDNKVMHVAVQGFAVTGDDNVLTNNSVVECGGHGFAIDGARNALTNCKVKDAAADGFHVKGADTSLDGCTAIDCAEEGLDNGEGTNTSATNCTLRQSRIDLAGNGTLATYAGTSYTTGGPDKAPEHP